MIAPDERILIIGAGPCGLAAARELERLGHRNWMILERSAEAGGLASSVVDPAGFTWDFGGHVVFSHFGEFDAMLREVMVDDVVQHDRSSYIRFADRWVPYPFQNNLRHLPEAVRDECLEGLAGAAGNGGSSASAAADGGSSASAAGNGESGAAGPRPDFATWMRAVFGEGITRHFMRPYNLKVWAVPPSEMSSGWIAERVAVVDYKRALRNVCEERDDVAWGPNNRFVFPARGGTGEIYRRLAARLADRIAYGETVVEVDAATRQVRLGSGEQHGYGALISTMPLDLLVASLTDCPQALRDAGKKLRHNGVYIVGVGYEAPLRDERSWLYFPDEATPFYRVTNFAKYAAANVPEGDTERYCSFMTETAYSESRPVQRAGLEDRVETALRAAGLVYGRPPIASIHVRDIPYAYPIPTLERDEALAVIQPWLAEQGVFSRGRFGSWRYEIGNMDHAVKMGIDVAHRLVTGSDEELA